MINIVNSNDAFSIFFSNDYSNLLEKSNVTFNNINFPD